MGSGQWAITMAYAMYYVSIIIWQCLPCLQPHTNIPCSQNEATEVWGRRYVQCCLCPLCLCVGWCFLQSRWPDPILSPSEFGENSPDFVSYDILLYISSLRLHQYIALSFPSAWACVHQARLSISEGFNHTAWVQLHHFLTEWPWYVRSPLSHYPSTESGNKRKW